ncbi:MAG: redoxin domain-containing protein [Candidatus Zixiibacteriota bacterium]|nr:MAG: redoxin domain-containing protein [candidate division Zixibacteria bacterium]
MAGDTKLSPKTIFIYLILVLVVAFIGVVAGNWFVEWRRSQGSQTSAEDWLVQNESLLKIGDPFPNEEVVSPEGVPDSTGALIANSKTIVLFLSAGCEPCKDAVGLWASEKDDLPGDVRILGICVGDTAEVAGYRRETGFPYALFCDRYFMFPQQYDVRSFPTMVGVTPQGTVAYVLHGYRENFTLKEAYGLLE